MSACVGRHATSINEFKVSIFFSMLLCSHFWARFKFVNFFFCFCCFSIVSCEFQKFKIFQTLEIRYFHHPTQIHLFIYRLYLFGIKNELVKLAIPKQQQQPASNQNVFIKSKNNLFNQSNLAWNRSILRKLCGSVNRKVFALARGSR